MANVCTVEQQIFVDIEIAKEREAIAQFVELPFNEANEIPAILCGDTLDYLAAAIRART